MPLISILVKQMGTNFLAHSILTSIISCYKEQLVNVVCFNTRYRNRNIATFAGNGQKGKNSLTSSCIANGTSLNTCAQLALTNLIQTSIYIY